MFDGFGGILWTPVDDRVKRKLDNKGFNSFGVFAFEKKSFVKCTFKVTNHKFGSIDVSACSFMVALDGIFVMVDGLGQVCALISQFNNPVSSCGRCS